MIIDSLRAAISRLRNGHHLDHHAYGDVIQYCADHRHFRQAKQVHARIVLHSIVPNNYLASKLIALYSKHGWLYEARRVFDEIPHKNLFSFNAMLIAYSIHDNPSRTIQFFSSMSNLLKPDAFTISVLVKSLSSGSCSLHRLVKEEIHGYVHRHGLEGDLFVGNGLVTLYSRCEELVSARKVFDAMQERDIVSWNAMVSGYSQGGFYEECLRLYQGMERNSDGLKPNNVTVVSVLHACAQLKDLGFGMEVHQSLAENEIEMDIAVWNSIVWLYAKCGRLDYARELFDGMPVKDGVTYGALISGYMGNGYVSQAMDLFRDVAKPALSTWNSVISGLAHNNCHSDVPELLREMQRAGFQPNSVTLSSVLPSVSFFSNLLGGKQIHGYAIRNNCDQNIYVAVSLIDAYAKAGFLRGAYQVFVSTAARSVIVWTSIISACASHGDANSAIALFTEMIDTGIQPDSVTFTAVLAACAHAGVVDEAWQIFDTMLSEYGIEPTAENYACMVGVLSRAGLLGEAVEFISKMSIKPNAKAWGALLNGASVLGDVEIARLAFNHLVEIEPESAGNYTIMANVYSKAGEWEEAEKVREMMRGMGLGKAPGCSWIEMSNGVQVFVARDTLNICSEEMYSVLECLVGVMREDACVSGYEYDEENFCNSQERNG